VHSEGLGKGSTFALTFPLVAQQLSIPSDAASPGIAAASQGRTKQRLLLVEDHAATRASLQRLLEHRGYRVTAAGTLGQARELVRQARFDLLLSDIGLPDGSGYELMTEVRRHWDVPGIALSGYGMEADVELSREAGFIKHLTKPVSVHALDAALAGIEGLRAKAPDGD
jgi:CheY-like chemotaxis protein